MKLKVHNTFTSLDGGTSSSSLSAIMTALSFLLFVYVQELSYFSVSLEVVGTVYRVLSAILLT